MPKITIYSTPNCSSCKQAKEYFEKKGFKYEEINVADDMDAQREMIKKSGQMTVPFIEVGDKSINGWKQAEFESALLAAN